jgi:tetratricopeptide (TPR) repeat protein
MMEDLHWSDESSRALLHFLARRVGDLRVLFVLSYRLDEAPPPLIRWLGRLEQEYLASEIRLERLDREGVAAMIEAIFHLGYSTSDFVTALYARTEGNPFFVEEFLKALITHGDIFQDAASGNFYRRAVTDLHVPRSIREAILTRLDGLSEETRSLLSFAAVIGQRFDIELLAHLTTWDDRRLVSALLPLVQQQLVSEETTEGTSHYAFRHALTRDVIYQQLLAPERKLLHQRVGEAMEHFYASDLAPFLSQLAMHFHLAHDWTRTMAYATQASQRAQAVHATVEALEQVDRALEAASHLGSPVSPEVIGSLHHRRGQLRAVFGQFEPVRHDLEYALASAQHANAAGFHWQTLLDLGTLWAGHKDYGRAQIYLQRALEMSRTQDNRGQMAHSLNAIGNLVLNQRRLAEALDAHQQALAIFTELDDRRGKAQTLDYLSMAVLMVGDVIEKDAFCRQAAELFTELDDRQGLVSTLATQSAVG